jgi:hypothetical protein
MSLSHTLTQINVNKEDGIYTLRNNFYKIIDGQLLTMSGTILHDKTIIKRIRKAKNEDGLFSFVFDDDCSADFVRLEYMCDGSQETSYASLNYVDDHNINVDLFDKRVVHKHCTSYKRSVWDISIKWRDIWNISKLSELPSWTPESSPDCSTCGSKSSSDSDEVDEEYEDSIGEGDLH